MGQGYPVIPEKNREAIPANEYIVDESHHPSHAYGSFAQSPFQKALIISFDGGSNDGSFNIFIGEKGKNLELIKSISIDLGSHYHVISSFCDEVKNYHVLTGAGKLLGLQSYGKVIEEWKLPIKKFFSYVPYWHELEKRTEQLSKEIGIPFSKTSKLLKENSYNIARTAQEVFEEIFFDNVDKEVSEHNLPLIITGGCALNIVLNTKIKNRYDREVFVAPNSSDCGIPVGLLCKHLNPTKKIDVTYKGVDVLDKHTLLEQVENRRGSKVSINQIVDYLLQNKILGVVQGRAEHGPRALGNRSIVCSPMSKDMKDILNCRDSQVLRQLQYVSLSRTKNNVYLFQ
jgi:carbamoyltransferase